MVQKLWEIKICRKGYKWWTKKAHSCNTECWFSSSWPIGYQKKINKKHKTVRADLDGAGLLDGLCVYLCIWVSVLCWLQKTDWTIDCKRFIKTPTKQEKLSMKERVTYYKEQYKKAKAEGYKGSYTSYTKKNGLGWKTIFYISRIRKWIRYS